jgi:pimeloyl-ACP methyl ester carboxylesterase
VTALVASDLGNGPAVVLVHGVGIGAWAFDGLAAALAADHRVLVVHRRGYGPADGPSDVPASAGVEDQVADLLALASARGVGRATWVGVSGGATLVLALAMEAPAIVRAAVVHEPLIGPLAPDLHAGVRAAADRLATGGPVWDFLTGLVGEQQMAALSPSAVEAVLRRSAVVRAEVPAFVDFAPTPADLARLSKTALVASVGSVSPRARQRAAAVLCDRAGATVEVLEGARHVPQLEAPAAFEQVIRAASPG